jgi:four helix bundle protein
MTPDDMKKRFKAYALRVINLVSSFAVSPLANIVSYQLLKAATSAAANYNAACIARSSNDFYHKLSIVEEETDESVFWIDLAADSGLAKRPLVEGLIAEGRELCRIVAKSRITTKSRNEARPGIRRPVPRKRLNGQWPMDNGQSGMGQQEQQ